MFKGFQNTSRSNGFNGFPALNFGMGTNVTFPYGISGVQLWLDASFGIVLNGNKVSKWNPRIGDNFLVQTTATAQPTYVLSDSNLNNLPSVNFNGYLTVYMDFGISIKMPSNWTITTVYKIDSLNNGNALLNNLTNVNTNSLIVGGTAGGYDGYGFRSGLNGGNEATVSYISSITNTNVQVNNSLASSGTAPTLTDTLFNRMGGDMSTNGSIIGRVSELIVFNKELSTTELSDLHTNINSKYAIY